MSRLKTMKLAQTFGAAALALTLALTGCGGASTDEAAETEQTTEDVAADTEAADDEIAISDEIAPAIEASKAITAEMDTLDEVDLDAYPEADDDADELEREDDLAEGTAEASKSKAGVVYLSSGGMEILVPSNWYKRSTVDGYELMSPDGTVCATMSATAKQAGYTYDASSAASNMPQYLASNGYTNIQVINHEVLSSTSGKLVDSFIQMSCENQGNTYIVYAEFLESKNYLNTLCICSPADGWSANYNDISTIVYSVSFAAGEFI